MAQVEIGNAAINAEMDKDGVARLSPAGSKRVRDINSLKETIYHLTSLMGAKELELATFTASPNHYAKI